MLALDDVAGRDLVKAPLGHLPKCADGDPDTCDQKDDQNAMAALSVERPAKHEEGQPERDCEDRAGVQDAVEPPETLVLVKDQERRVPN